MRLVRADTFLRRARGLGLRRSMPADEALLIPRCRSVHTLTMRFALDLVWLDGDGAVVRVDRGVRPLRFRSCRRAESVIELAAEQQGAPALGVAPVAQGQAEGRDDRIRLVVEQARDDQALRDAR